MHKLFLVEVGSGDVQHVHVWKVELVKRKWYSQVQLGAELKEKYTSLR
jgi:hypothetical protein